MPGQWGERHLNLRQQRMPREAVDDCCAGARRDPDRMFGADSFDLSVTSVDEGLFHAPAGDGHVLQLSLRGSQLFRTRPGTMNPLPVLHHGGRWLAYSGRQRQLLDAAPELERPARVLAELPGAISAVTTIKGARAHVAAQIEKRLREDGLTDGESQVIVHHVERLGGACRVFYTACPAEAWQDLLAWAQAQSDHCLVFLPEALLWHCLAPGQGVVARLGRHLYFIGRHGRQPLYARATALSDGNDELLAAASLLGRRVAASWPGWAAARRCTGRSSTAGQQR